MVGGADSGSTSYHYLKVLCFMKKEVNCWVINVFLTVGTSFLFNAEYFPGINEDFSDMSTITLSGYPEGPVPQVSNRVRSSFPLGP